MTAELDPRIVRVTIQVGSKLKTYDGIAITANGTKYANSLQNECEITLTNLDRNTQDYILTETSPYNRNRSLKSVLVEAGRQSYGVAKIFRGNIVSSTLSQPPDIAVTLKCLTGNFLKGNILAQSFGQAATVKQISQQFAQNSGLALNFQATDKNVGNYAYNGSALKQVGQIGSLGGVDAYIDDDNFIVKNSFVPLTNTLRILNADTGMIGIPQFTEQGIRVKFLLDNRTTLGGSLQIESSIYPAINGRYVIYKLGFEIANRDTPFYYIAEASRGLRFR